MRCCVLSKRPSVRIIIAGLLVIAFAFKQASAATSAEIDAAIEKAKYFLYAQQKPGGHWEIDARRRGTEHENVAMQGDTFGGYTALATYALLASGENPQETHLRAAIDFLKDADVIGIYALGVRANVWKLLPSIDKRAKAMATHDAKLLIDGLQTAKDFPAARGFWDYGNGHGPNLLGRGRTDHSVSQYGVLGLWASAENDVPINRTVWETIDAAWKSHQYPDGGWSYDMAPTAGYVPTASMTAAGVATLFITDEVLHTTRGIDCGGNIANENIEKGMAWMTDHFKEVNNPYVLYGVERIGAASGRKYFGTNNWYTAGADILLHGQHPDGSWTGGFPGGENPVSTTAFAMLFLVRGREPVMMNKLQYDVISRSTHEMHEARWNQRPRDVANLTRWTGNRIEHGLNWQVTSLKAPLDDLLDAPVLYMSGDEDLNFSSDDEHKLRDFVEAGGMILGHADCGGGKTLFAESFESLGRKLFPAYEFRELPADHLIFTDQQYSASKWKSPVRLRGLSNGVREFMVVIPDSDPARAWQLHAEQSSEVAFQLGADIFLYAVDRTHLTFKGDSFILNPDPNIIADKSARLGRLLVGDNPDPEPAAWHRLAALLHNRYKFDIDVDKVRLGGKKLSPYKVLLLTGTTRFTLSPTARVQLVEYIEHGGTLIIDAAGGSRDFADAAAAELKACFPKTADEALKSPLSPDHEIFHLHNARIGEFAYRDIYRRHVIGNLKTPRLNGISLGNRVAVFFSREDLTAGIVGEPVDGIAGYSPQTATEIMRNMVLYSAFGVRIGA